MNNRDIVAQALQIARTVSISEGFRFLEENGTSIKGDRLARFTWFQNKCREHGITQPIMKF